MPIIRRCFHKKFESGLLCYCLTRQVWDVCEELQTFIQDSTEVLWSEVNHLKDSTQCQPQGMSPSIRAVTFGEVNRIDCSLKRYTIEA